MSYKYARLEEFELSRETTRDSQDVLDFEGEEAGSQPPARTVHRIRNPPSFLAFLKSLLPNRNHRRSIGPTRRPRRPPVAGNRTCIRRSTFRRLVLLSYAFLAALLSTIVLAALFWPSYTHPPPHYQHLRFQVQSSVKQGRGNLGREKVFIAASIYDHDGNLAGGTWGQNLLDLVHLLGPEHVYLSIYENDAGSKAEAALRDLEQRVECPHSLVFEEHLDLGAAPPVQLPDGTKRVKRIAYLAEVRNRALRPLENSSVRYDKLLYLNDVVFNPTDVLQLLFSTNAKETGLANYRAACAVDFINPFKFYDTFATRDAEGYSMGIPFFPWFSASGEARSLQDVLDGEDAVQVRSCWGGVVAFDAKYFQKALSDHEEPYTAARETLNATAPYHFRAEKDLFWDSSECCLIQADIQNPTPDDSGIYMNPYVRVAYDQRTLSWLGFTRRFERLYSPIHFLLDTMAGMPWYNPRRTEEPLSRVEELVWMPDDKSPAGGSFQAVWRVANHAGFCGRRGLPVIKQDITPGEKNWEVIPLPP